MYRPFFVSVYRPDHIHTGNCLANYLHPDLHHPQSMPLHTYLTEFLLVLHFLKGLELLWELPISDTKQLSIFLYSFLHHMVCQFTTNPTLETPTVKLTLVHITDDMQTILINNISKNPQRPAHSLCLPSFVPSVDPIDYASNKQEPLLPFGPLPLRTNPPLQPIYLVSIPA